MFAGLVTAAGFKPVAGFENEFRVGSIPIHSRHYFTRLFAAGHGYPLFTSPDRNPRGSLWSKR